MKTQNTKESNILTKVIENILIGQPQKYENMEIIPLFSQLNPATKYLMLKEGLATGKLEIIEKNPSGTVSELKVKNLTGKRILFIDGEELSGAKQNRILNTTILIKKHSETIIPVSCTEEGRWNYTSENFEDSDVVATPQIRKGNVQSVSYSLSKNSEFISNQKEVWHKVNAILTETKFASPTNALKDFFDIKKKDINDFTEKIKYRKNQQGFIVRVNGKIIGMDYLSSSRGFKTLFPKLIKSYAAEADLKKKKSEQHQFANEDSVETFLEKIKSASYTSFKSPGHGYDLRIKEKQIDGKALQYKDEIIHLSVFVNNG